jgi:hypothetical protein
MTRLKILLLTASLYGCATVRMYSDPTGDLSEYSKIALSNRASLQLNARSGGRSGFGRSERVAVRLPLGRSAPRSGMLSRAPAC